MKKCKCGNLIRNHRVTCRKCYFELRKANRKKYFCSSCSKALCGSTKTGLCSSCEDISRRKSNFCIDCGIEITLQGKRCIPCGNKEGARKRNFIGSNNPNWNGGIAYQGYATSFTRKLKSKIRDRDNHTCQLCGKTTEENGKLLEVHHIDYDKQNSNEYNLISLCKYCHGKMHGRKANREYWLTNCKELISHF